MFNRAIKYFRHLRAMQRVNLALARGGATSRLRNIDPLDPGSWEFSAFSQNGEDGIIDYLTEKLLTPNRYFIEIGSSDGLENNTAWLAIAKKYSGLMIEGDNRHSAFSREIMAGLNIGVECLNLFVNRENIGDLTNNIIHKNPDVLSIDIDGNDYYITKTLIEVGLRPKIVVVEYNSVFGPFNSATIRYRDDFDCSKAHRTQLYYGVSITGWKIFFKPYDYKFITVEKNGVNAVFVDIGAFEPDSFKDLKGIDFNENFFQMRRFKVNWEQQFELIKEMDFFEIG
jgi:hypothetical protein